MLTRRTNMFEPNVFSIFDDLFKSTSLYNDDTFSEDETSYTFKLAVPGFEEKDLQVQIHNDVLTVSGKHEKKESEKDKHFIKEFSSFTRSYSLANDAVKDAVTAECKAGVLVITVPKGVAKNPVRQIPVKTG